MPPGKLYSWPLTLIGPWRPAELDADEVFLGAGDPLGSGERRTGGGAFAVLAVAGTADEELLLAGFHDCGIDATGGGSRGFSGNFEGGWIERDGLGGGLDGVSSFVEAGQPGDDVAEFAGVEHGPHRRHGRDRAG